MLSANEERLRAILLGQEQLLQEAHAILAEEQVHDDVLRAAVLSSKGHRVNRIKRLDPARVFHVDAIRALCVRYRLRFLDGARFKGHIPGAALVELRRLESRSPEPLRGFKVMAPAVRFKTCDSNADPMLFVAVGPEHYYLVHRWGADMHPLRAWLCWPLRGPAQAITSVLVLALIAAAALPNMFVGADPAMPWWGSHRLLAALWTVMLSAGFGSFGWFAFLGRFSSTCWNDPRVR